MQTADQQTEATSNRRMANEARYMDRRDRLEALIEREGMIGELIRDGKKVYYFFPVGAKKSYEAVGFGGWMEVADYIIRNGWVR